MGINNEIDKIHELDLVISEELKRICEKHDIKYFYDCWDSSWSCET